MEVTSELAGLGVEMVGVVVADSISRAATIRWEREDSDY